MNRRAFLSALVAAVIGRKRLDRLLALLRPKAPDLDYFIVTWPVQSREWELGCYVQEILALQAPFPQALITNISQASVPLKKEG